MWINEENEWIYTINDVKIGSIRKVRDIFFAFYKDIILQGFKSLDEAKQMVENPKINYQPKIDEKYTARP